MSKKTPGFSLAAVIILGSIWGLSEAALGMGLKKCASSVSGSVMTGVAFFFIAAAWTISKRFSTIFLIVLIASVFKLFDAQLLSLPVLHGAIGNPIFAFITQGAAFLLLMMVVSEKLTAKTAGFALVGGLSSLLAVNLFPLVRYATGIPACTVAGTGYPLSLYYSYIAVALSAVLLPLGVLVGHRISRAEWMIKRKFGARSLAYIASPATVIICLLIMILIRRG